MIDARVKEPFVIDIGMKFVLLAMSDLFYNLAMIIVVAIFGVLKGVGPVMEEDDERRFIWYSMIDFGSDFVFFVLVCVIWQRGKEGFRKMELF